MLNSQHIPASVHSVHSTDSYTHDSTSNSPPFEWSAIVNGTSLDILSKARRIRTHLANVLNRNHPRLHPAIFAEPRYNDPAVYTAATHTIAEESDGSNGSFPRSHIARHRSNSLPSTNDDNEDSTSQYPLYHALSYPIEDEFFGDDNTVQTDYVYCNPNTFRRRNSDDDMLSRSFSDMGPLSSAFTMTTPSNKVFSTLTTQVDKKSQNLKQSSKSTHKTVATANITSNDTKKDNSDEKIYVPSRRSVAELKAPPEDLGERPFVTLTYAQSLDGAIAAKHAKPLVISSEDTLNMTHALRAAHDCIVIGVGTAVNDNPSLTTRRVPGKSPQPILLDPFLRCPLHCKLLNGTETRRPLIFAADPACTPQRPPVSLQVTAAVQHKQAFSNTRPSSAAEGDLQHSGANSTDPPKPEKMNKFSQQSLPTESSSMSISDNYDKNNAFRHEIATTSGSSTIITDGELPSNLPLDFRRFVIPDIDELTISQLADRFGSALANLLPSDMLFSPLVHGSGDAIAWETSRHGKPSNSTTTMVSPGVLTKYRNLTRKFARMSAGNPEDAPGMLVANSMRLILLSPDIMLCLAALNDTYRKYVLSNAIAYVTAVLHGDPKGVGTAQLRPLPRSYKSVTYIDRSLDVMLRALPQVRAAWEHQSQALARTPGLRESLAMTRFAVRDFIHSRCPSTFRRLREICKNALELTQKAYRSYSPFTSVPMSSLNTSKNAQQLASPPVVSAQRPTTSTTQAQSETQPVSVQAVKPHHSIEGDVDPYLESLALQMIAMAEDDQPDIQSRTEYLATNKLSTVEQSNQFQQQLDFNTPNLNASAANVTTALPPTVVSGSHSSFDSSKELSSLLQDPQVRDLAARLHQQGVRAMFSDFAARRRELERSGAVVVPCKWYWALTNEPCTNRTTSSAQSEMNNVPSSGDATKSTDLKKLVLLDWDDVLRKLYLLGYRSVMVEGGSFVIGHLLALHALYHKESGSHIPMPFDKLVITVAPVFVGSEGPRALPSSALHALGLSDDAAETIVDLRRDFTTETTNVGSDLVISAVPHPPRRAFLRSRKNRSYSTTDRISGTLLAPVHEEHRVLGSGVLLDDLPVLSSLNCGEFMPNGLQDVLGGSQTMLSTLQPSSSANTDLVKYLHGTES